MTEEILGRKATHTARTTRTLARKSSLTVLIVHLALLRVGKNVVCMADLLELFRGSASCL
jgi:hypothetical protein